MNDRNTVDGTDKGRVAQEIEYLTEAGMPFKAADTFSLHSEGRLAYLSLFKVEPMPKSQLTEGRLQAYCVGRFALAQEALPILSKVIIEHLSKVGAELDKETTEAPKGDRTNE